MFARASSRIVSTGVAIPEGRLSSDQVMLEIGSRERFGLEPQWLRRVTGIEERSICADGLLPSDLAVEAACEALERAGVLAGSLDVIIYTGITRDHMVEPGTAHVVQHKLGARRATVVDLNNACLGFINGVHIMDALIATGQVKHGLVVTGEQGSRFMHKTIASLRASGHREALGRLAAGLTVGDAGAAMLLGPKRNDALGIAAFQMESDGQHAKLCYCGDVMETGLLYTDMPAVLGAGAALSATTFKELLEVKLKWRREELAAVVPHQVGKGSMKVCTDVLGVSKDIVSQSVSHLGNITTATIPVNLHRLMYEAPLAEGDKVVLAGAGSGVSAAHAGIVWESYA